MGLRGGGLLVLLAAAPLLAQQQTPGPGPTAPTQTTEVRGTVPDLSGRWLVALRLGTTQRNPAVVTLRFWDVTAPGGVPRVEDRPVRLPPAMAERQKQAGVTWTPTPADLRELVAAWNDLPVEERGVATVKTEIDEKSRFDDLLKSEEAARDAAWALRQTVTFQPGGGRPVRELVVLGIDAQTPTGFRGKAALVMLAMAPFPVPISLRGTVDMYRLEERRGLVARMLDTLSGCGRRP